MENAIKKIIELSHDYVTFGREAKLPNTHVDLRTSDPLRQKHDWVQDGELIGIYFSDNRKTWCTYFGRIEVTGYRDRICFPTDFTKEELIAAHKDAEEYLHKYLLPNVAKVNLTFIKARQDEIDKLEQKLKELKGEEPNK